MAVVVELRCVQVFMDDDFRFHATDFGGTTAGWLLLGGVVEEALNSMEPVG